MSKTIYFTDDEDILVEFGQLMPLYPKEAAELLWLRAGGEIRQATAVPGPAGYNPPPDNVQRPEKPTPAPPAKLYDKSGRRNTGTPSAAKGIYLESRGSHETDPFADTPIELKCHCGAIIGEICPTP